MIGVAIWQFFKNETKYTFADPVKNKLKHRGKVFISVYINQSCGRLGWSSQIFFDKFKENWKSVSGEVQVGSLRQGQYLKFILLFLTGKRVVFIKINWKGFRV